jgi:hypothetical protein
LLALWKPSFYRGIKYFPEDIRFSALVVPDKPYTGLVLASMFSIRSYAFIVLGWSIQPSSSDLERITLNILRQFGAIELEKDKKLITLDPTKAKLDYISHKISQAYANPRQIVENVEQMRSLISNSRVIPIAPPPHEKGRSFTKTAIIRVDEPKIAIFGIEKLHPGLITKEISIEEFEQISINPRGSARIMRRGDKTYIDIIDHYEIDEPFSSTEIYQTHTNWVAWRETIESSDYYLFISTLPPDHKPEKIKLVSKIRVISIDE